jgi:D-beta-D-heptose 7-phosphate kinase/D-beta-D-heptose 1-phosphate adenosyltransferase
MHADLLDIVERFTGTRLVLVGDFLLDRYVFGDAERISPEAPVPVLRVVERQDGVGGSGSVAQNILSLGGQVACFGLLGRDGFGDRVDELLKAAGADTAGLLRVADRPTITKTRMVGLAEHRHRQQILRVDDEIVGPPTDADAAKLVELVTQALADADVVLLEDYAKGVLSPEICQRLIQAAREMGKPVLVDPARSGDWSKYNGATLLTPNHAELEFGFGSRIAASEIDGAATQLVEKLRLDAMVVTVGRDGARLIRRGKAALTFPTRPRAVYDNTGAGDAVLAMMGVALAAGATLEQAVPLANIAGGLEVSKFGCVPISAAEVLEELNGANDVRARKVRAVDDLLAELESRRNRGETVVFTNGCFDILHPGHLKLLEEARAMGSLLIVGVNSDASVRRQEKGDDRPIRNQDERMHMLAALECVDYVVMFDESSVLPLIKRIVPDVLVKGGDYDLSGVVGREFVESRGGRVALVPAVAGYSTTREVERIRGGSSAS